MKNSKLFRASLILLLLIAGTLPVVFHVPKPSKPLWPGSKFTEQDRDAAAERGLAYIGKVASDPKQFSLWGSDLLWCFYSISNTAKNEHLRGMALRIGQERARQWRSDHPFLMFTSPSEFTMFVFGTDAADRLLGDHDEKIRRDIIKVAAAFDAVDFLSFNPRIEPPPRDIPEVCPKCQYFNRRGATHCARCRTALDFLDPYDVWEDALVTTYSGDIYGVKLGASYADVVKWAGVMRPYPSPGRLQEGEIDDEFGSITYAVTHLIYTQNDYGMYRLSPDSMPQEFDFLRANIGVAENQGNGEILGEFLDTLRAFGRNDSDPEMRKAIEYLLLTQNPDGSWGDTTEDVYTRYHSTWTAVDGLRQYAYRGERHPNLPDALPAMHAQVHAFSRSVAAH